MKKGLLFLILGFTLSIYGQDKKELSLSDAVLNQYRSFGPDRLIDVKWVPGNKSFSFVKKGFSVLFLSDVASGTSKEVVTIEKVNKALNASIAGFYGVEWLTSDEVLLSDGQNYFSYSISKNTGKKLYSLEEAAANVQRHAIGGIAYTIGNNIHLLSLDGKITKVTANEDPEIVSGQSIARNEFGIAEGLFWSNSGAYLAFYQKDEKEVANYPLLDITKTPGELISIKYPMTGQLSEKPRLGIFSLATGNTVFVKPRGAMDDYLTNVCFTPDNKYVLIAEVNRDQNHMWLNCYDVVSGNFVKTIFEEKNDKWIEPEHPAFFPSWKSNNFIWISERDGFNNLYYYDFSSGSCKSLTQNKFVAKNVLMASASGEVFFTATGPNATNTLLYKVDLKGKQTLLTNTDGTHEVSISSDGRYFIDFYTNVKENGKTQLLDSKGTLKHTLLSSPNKLEPYSIGTCELGTLKGKDGSILYTRMIKPSNFDPAKKYPVLVYVYGGPHAQMVTNSWLGGANLWMYWMAEQGYIVYTLDNRGSGERGFAFESQIHRQLGTVEMEDQLTGVYYLRSLPYVDGNRLAVHGWSFGGYMTTSLMLRHAGVFNVGVAGGPVTDWKYYEVMYGERYMDRPEQNKEGYELTSLMNHAQNLKGDLLLIHGTVDDVVVLQHNYALVKKFIELGIQMDFFPYPMHKHNVYGKDRVHLIEKILTYVIEHNQ